MREISYEAYYGWDGANRSGVIEVPDDFTEIEISEVIQEIVYGQIKWSWEDITREDLGR